MPENDRNWYSNKLRDGRTALSVRVTGDDQVDEIESIMAEAGALDIDSDDDDVSTTGMTGSSARSSTQTTQTRRGRAGETEEQVIPVVNEELAVGRRTTEKRRLVRTHVIERPVTETVQLKDETVVIERRPVSGAGKAVGGDIQEREFEIIERREEPVVEKRARAVEEIVVKKDVSSRTETVKDSVRETHVEVEGKTVPKKRV